MVETLGNYCFCAEMIFIIHSNFFRIIVAVASTDVKNTMLYYGTDDGSNLGAHFAFNFQFITRLDGQSTAKDVVDSVNEWLNYMPLEYTANWAVSGEVFLKFKKK